MTCEAITVVPARTVVVNMAAQIIITTAHDSTLLTPITVVPDTTMAVDLTRTTATTRVGRIRTGATARPGDTTRTHTMAVIRTLVTTTTIPTTRQRTVITYQWPLCSVALGNSGITMAQSTESSDHGPVAP